ncbi:MAG: ABC transporter permease [Oscillospiraceae bacterium]|nr:ABC transporter permease [Oscillospiraceae bacterium]
MLPMLIKRDCKLFFKDKGTFFSALITPLILLFLYSTFLAKLYRSTFVSALPSGLAIGGSLINGCVGGQLLASLLAVSCVTVTFCVNLIMIQDKTTGAIRDLTIAPVRSTALALAYYVSTFICAVIVNVVAFAAGLVYLKAAGWYLSFSDILLVFVDILLLTMFATALSSIICYPLSTQGAASAVGTLVSCSYGFLCGAYMPISNFGSGLQKVLSFLPGTYGTALLKNHLMRGNFAAMIDAGVPKEAVDGIKEAIDCTPKFFSHKVTVPEMLGVMAVSVLALVGIYVLMNIIAGKKHAK